MTCSPDGSDLWGVCVILDAMSGGCGRCRQRTASERGRVITTERLVLRRPVDTDADFVLALHSDPEDDRAQPGRRARRAPGRSRRSSRDVERALGTGTGLLDRRGKRSRSTHRSMWSEGGRPPRPPVHGTCCTASFRRHGATGTRARPRARASRRQRRWTRPDRSLPGSGQRTPESARVAETIGLVRRPDLDLDGEDGRDELWSTARSASTT